jgi:DNA-entry nuclease
LKVRKIVIILLSSLIFCLWGCADISDDDIAKGEYTKNTKSLGSTVSVQEKTDDTEDAETTEDTTEEDISVNGDDVSSDYSANGKSTGNLSSDNESFLSTDDIPEYSGAAYITINGNVPEFSDEDKKNTDAFENYSDLDSLGRCGQAYANICPELQPTEERGEIGQIKPSGWHTVKYNGLVEGNYLYNRCHLIGYQLAGENANEKNLITGTRYFNTVGMLPFEDEVDDYVDRTGNHVLYRVTPVFEGDNLVANGVQMEAWSVEDEGQGVCFNVFCYNVQPGIYIDYTTGESCIDDTTNAAESTATTTNKSAATNTGDSTPTSEGTATTTSKSATSKSGDSTDTSEGTAATTSKSTTSKSGDSTTTSESTTTADKDSSTCDYILNKNTKKIHLPDCSSVSDMAEKNKVSYNGTIDELESQGYTPCKRCISR